MGPELLFATVESALLRWIRWGLAWRRPAVVDLAALVARPVVTLPKMALVFVQSEGVCYEWDPEDRSAESAPNVLASSALPANSFGRWRRLVTTLRYGAGGAALASKQSGYLRAIESWESDDGPDAAIERVMDNLPSVLVQLDRDDPESKDVTPGHVYRSKIAFKLLVLSQHLGGAPNATIGPRDDVNAAYDPGAYRIIGDLRRLLGGLAFHSDVAEIERLTIGPAALEFEDLDRRVYVWSMALTASAWWSIEDEDTIALSLRLQPANTQNVPTPDAFDAANYVAAGGHFSEGPGGGLSRSIVATLAKVAGQTVSAAETAVTFAADRDTYRDLLPSGAWALTAVLVNAPAPALQPGALRVAVTRTDAAGIVSDRALCSYSIAFGPPIDLP